MIKKVVFYFLCILFLFCVLPSFSQDQELVTRYLTAANDQFSEGSLAKAFSYINVVLSSYTANTIPQNVEVFSETIYFSYLESIKTSYDWNAFNNIKEKLIEFPYLSTERITRTVKVLNAYEAQGGIPDSWIEGSGSSIQGQRTASTLSRDLNELELQLALEKTKTENAEQNQKFIAEQQKEMLQTQKEVYERALKEVQSKSQSDNQTLVLVLLIIGGISLIILISIILNVLLSLKNYKDQNIKFQETLKVVSEMNYVQARTNMAIPSLPPHFNGAEQNIRYLGSSTNETKLPEEPTSEVEQRELEELALTCKELGTRIDTVTARKNNSKNVAELVYKISQEMGFSQYEGTLFFSVAMVYDIGFLHIDTDLLQKDNLSEAEKNSIRCHVKEGITALTFVPDKYLNLFEDGILKHHENIDGSGYPEGLTGEDIPYIARVLRVAESFVSLISKRSYRNIFDKETAIKELKSQPHLYDAAIIEVLETII